MPWKIFLRRTINKNVFSSLAKCTLKHKKSAFHSFSELSSIHIHSFLNFIIQQGMKSSGFGNQIGSIWLSIFRTCVTLRKSVDTELFSLLDRVICICISSLSSSNVTLTYLHVIAEYYSMRKTEALGIRSLIWPSRCVFGLSRTHFKCTTPLINCCFRRSRSELTFQLDCS